MEPIRKTIEIQGVTVRLLVTPALYGVAKRRGIDLTVPKGATIPEVMDIYCKMMFCAAINAHEVARVDSPLIGDFALKYEDFEEFRTTRPDEFRKVVEFIYSALTQKSFQELVVEQVKKKKRNRNLT